MKVNGGDVLMTRFPHASGIRGKKRPTLVVQADAYNVKVGHALVAEITTNLTPAREALHGEGEPRPSGRGRLIQILALPPPT